MFWVELVPAFLFFFLLFFIPESPRYFVLVGKIDEAKSVLQKLFSEEEIEAKLAKIQESLQDQNMPSPKSTQTPKKIFAPLPAAKYCSSKVAIQFTIHCTYPNYSLSHLSL